MATLGLEFIEEALQCDFHGKPSLLRVAVAFEAKCLVSVQILINFAFVITYIIFYESLVCKKGQPLTQIVRVDPIILHKSETLITLYSGSVLLRSLAYFKYKYDHESV
ncbi:hypothetical protein K501DRAFT_279293 [Backusella circina FSU 941]|nr:hypothetical protein K501DRAFT_279293 [Backusella circina FSU 941]